MKTEPAAQIPLDDTAAQVLKAIPFDRYVSDEEILMQVEDINPNELPTIMIELDMKGYVIEDAGRYKRKLGG